MSSPTSVVPGPAPRIGQSMARVRLMWVLLGTAILLGGLHLLFATTGYAHFHSDSTAFSPIALSVAQGKGLHNFTWQWSYFLDRTGEGRMVYHGPLFGLIVGHLLVSATAGGLIVALAVLQASAMLLTALWIMLRMKHQGGDLSAWDWLANIGLLLAVSSVAFYVSGRPETLCILWMLLGMILIEQTEPGLGQSAGLGVFVALMFATSPFSGGLSGLSAVLYLLWRMPLKRALQAILALAGTAVLALLATMTLAYPYPLRDWVAGMIFTAPFAGARGGHSFRLALQYWFATPYFPMLGVSLALAGAVAAEKLQAIQGTPARLLYAACLSLMGWGLLSKAVAFSPIMYNALGIAPAWLALILCWKPGDSAGLWRRCAYGLGGVMLCLHGVGFLQHLAGFPAYQRSGVTLAEARARFATLPVQPGQRVAVPYYSQLWLLSDHPEQFISWMMDPREPMLGPVTLDPALPKEGRQFYPRYSLYDLTAGLPSLPGTQLVQPYHQKVRARTPVGLPIGYDYAVYELEPQYQQH